VVSGAAVGDLNVKYLFTPEQGIDTFITVSANADKNAMKRLGYPDFPFITGTVGAQAKVAIGDKNEQTSAILDLTEATVDYDLIDWQKPLKEPATLELTSEKNNGTLTIPSFHLSAKNIEAKGSATITPDFSSIETLNLTGFNYNGSDISTLNYSKKSGITALDIVAKTLNLTSYTEKTENEEAKNANSGFSFKNFPAVQLKTDINKLIIDKNREIINLKGSLLCDDICQSANLTGITGGKPFTIKIFNDKSGRILDINAGDAGSFLSNLGVLEGMNGGSLKLNGNYNNTPSGSILIAKLVISEHTIKNAPLLGKILALASLTGFIDTLQGNGIRFTELSIPFTLHNDVATLDKGKTHGSALGITVDGTITFPSKTLNLQGTIVPSYAINSVLGNVPIIGEQLMGGTGQGLLAARYSIKGREQNADVSVNPLSILTPGFLRGLFGVLDEEKKKPEE
jgi:hypothetical protein